MAGLPSPCTVTDRSLPFAAVPLRLLRSRSRAGTRPRTWLNADAPERRRWCRSPWLPGPPFDRAARAGSRRQGRGITMWSRSGGDVAMRCCLCWMTWPGTPTTTESGGTGLTTTALAPVRLSWPTVIGPRILAPAPMVTRSPMAGSISPDRVDARVAQHEFKGAARGRVPLPGRPPKSHGVDDQDLTFSTLKLGILAAGTIDE